MLEAPIVEVLKPKMIEMLLPDMVPENIIPLLELLGATAIPFRDKTTGADYWLITTKDGRHYTRCEQQFLGADEDTWRELIGHLLDYAAKENKS